MPIKDLVIDNPERFSPQIKQLRDLVIEYHHAEPPFLQTWGGLIGTGIIVLVGFFTQWKIFKLNRRKEIELKVADLFGKLNAKSLFFKHNLYEVSQNYSVYVANDRLYKWLQVNKPDQTKYISDCQNASKKNKELFEEAYTLHKKEKVDLYEILYQIHFYYNNAVILEQIEKFKKMTKPNFVETIPIEELSEKNSFVIHILPKLNQQNQDCKEIFETISAQMLNSKY